MVSHEDQNGQSMPGIISKLPRRKVGEGGRNRLLAHHGGSVVQQGGDLQTVQEVLRVINAEDCLPPLPDAEVVKIARSISKYREQNRRSQSGDGGGR